MKIYLAASYKRRTEMQGVRKILEGMGHTVTSRWLDGPETPDSDRDRWREESVKDVEDVKAAGVLMFFTSPDIPGAGRHTELGIAIATRKIIVVVGPPERNVFHELPGIIRIASKEVAMEWAVEAQKHMTRETRYGW